MQQEQRQLTSTDIRTSTATQLDTLGATGQTADNRQFSYVGVGATAVVPGQLLVTPAVVANHQGIKIASGSQTAVGSKRLMLTLGATAATQNQYAEGYLTVVTLTGAGVSYKIKGNTPGVSSGTVEIDLLDEEPLITAVDSTTTFNLSASPYGNIVASSSSTPAHAVGIATSAIPANYYGWVQTYGYCSALIDASGITKGYSFTQSSATNGAIGAAGFITPYALLGNTLENCTAGQYNGVWLQIT